MSQLIPPSPFGSSPSTLSTTTINQISQTIQTVVQQTYITQNTSSTQPGGTLSGLYVPVSGGGATGGPPYSPNSVGRRSCSMIATNTIATTTLVWQPVGISGLTNIAGGDTVVATVDGYSSWGSYLTNAVSGDNGGFYFTNMFCELDHQPLFIAIVRIPTIVTFQRIFIGISDSQTAITTDSSLSSNFCGFRYSTTVGDAGWVPFMNKASGTKTVTGAPVTSTPVAGSIYVLAFWVSSNVSAPAAGGLTAIYFSSGWNGLPGSNYPPNTTMTSGFPTGIAMSPFLSFETTSNNARQLDVNKLYLEAN